MSEELTDSALIEHARTAASNLSTILKAIQKRGIEVSISQPVDESRTIGDRQTIYGVKLTFTKEL